MSNKITPCTKCGRETFYVVTPFELRDHDYRNVTNPLAAVLGDEPEKDLGSFELRICAGCGLSELYATDLTELAQAAKQNRKVRVVSASTGYR